MSKKFMVCVLLVNSLVSFNVFASELGDFERYSNGKFMWESQAYAKSYCDSRGMRLPTAEEALQDAEERGLVKIENGQSNDTLTQVTFSYIEHGIQKKIAYSIVSTVSTDNSVRLPYWVSALDVSDWKQGFCFYGTGFSGHRRILSDAWPCGIVCVKDSTK